MITRLFCLFLLAFLPLAQSAEPTLGEQLARDNPKVIAYLQSLKPGQQNKKVQGVKLSDGSVELEGAVFLGSRHITARKQHVFLFKNDGSYYAYVWIDKGGKSLNIPKDKSGEPGEDAHLLSGDIYTYPIVEPGDGLVILTGANPAWLDKL